MNTLNVKIDDELITWLQETAKKHTTTADVIVQKALRAYLQPRPISPKRYSFIGIGHSGKRNISSQVEETLNAANRQEGWSLP